MDTTLSVLEASAETPNYPASGLSRGQKWETDGTEKTVHILFALNPAVPIQSISIVNNGAAFVKFKVGNNLNSLNDIAKFDDLSTMRGLRRPPEITAGTNVNASKLFEKDELGPTATAKKWNRLLLEVKQPFSPAGPFGLSAVRVNATTEPAKSSQKSSTPNQTSSQSSAPAVKAATSSSQSTKPNSQSNNSQTLKPTLEVPLLDDDLPTDDELEQIDTKAILQSKKMLKQEEKKLASQLQTAVEKQKPATASASRSQAAAHDSDNEEMADVKPKQRSLPSWLGGKTTTTAKKTSKAADNDDEEEKPASKKTTSKKKTASKKSDEEEDDEEEKPKAKKKAAPKKPTAFKPIDDDDEPEDAKPASKPAASSSKAKAAKDDDDDEEEKPAPKKAAKKQADKPAKTKKKATKRKRNQDDEEVDVAFDKIMEGCTFVISGIANPERGELRDKVIEMGGKYMNDWGPESTHLISSSFRGAPKYKEALKAKGIIVGPEFVNDCHDKKKRLSPKKYLLEKDEEDDDEEEADDEDDEDDGWVPGENEEPDEDYQPPAKKGRHSKNSDDDDEYLDDEEKSKKPSKKAETFTKGAGFADLLKNIVGKNPAETSKSAAASKQTKKPVASEEEKKPAAKVADKPAASAKVADKPVAKVPTRSKEEPKATAKASSKPPAKPAVTLSEMEQQDLKAFEEIFKSEGSASASSLKEFIESVFDKLIASADNPFEFFEEWRYKASVPKTIRMVAKTHSDDKDTFVEESVKLKDKFSKAASSSDSGYDTEELDEADVNEAERKMKAFAQGPNAELPSFLAGVKAYVDENVPEDQKRLATRYLIAYGGEEEEVGANPTVTHILVPGQGSASHEEYKEQYPKAKIVEVEWILTCHRRQSKVTELPFIVD